VSYVSPAGTYRSSVDEQSLSDFADLWCVPGRAPTCAATWPAYIAALNIVDANALLSTGKVRARLDPAVTAKKGIERHHLFPRAYLRKQKMTGTKQINQIANMPPHSRSVSGSTPANHPRHRHRSGGR
jgi:hypothetical protein